MAIRSSWSFRVLRSAVVAILGLLAVAHKAQGQATPAAINPGGYIAVGATGSIFQVDYGQGKVGGVALYADVNLTERYGAEVQVQSLRFHQEGDVRETTFLAGPRISFRSHGLVPYAKLLVGEGRFDAPYGYAVGRYFVLAPGAGIDYTLGRRIKFRLINVDYQSWPQFTFGPLHPYGVSSGISFRIF